MLVFFTGYTTASLDHKLLNDAYFVTLRVSEMKRNGYMFPWLVDMLAATVQRISSESQENTRPRRPPRLHTTYLTQSSHT